MTKLQWTQDGTFGWDQEKKAPKEYKKNEVMDADETDPEVADLIKSVTTSGQAMDPDAYQAQLQAKVDSAEADLKAAQDGQAAAKKAASSSTAKADEKKQPEHAGAKK